MSKPIAVLISDVHYNINTLEVADAAMRQAIDKANTLKVPLIVAGDLHDTKAVLRAECVNAMISTFISARERPTVLVGNHCRLNEKSDEHALQFLSPYANVVRSPVELNGLNFIPYQSTKEAMLEALSEVPKGSLVICHTGVLGANMGHYIKDTSSLPPEVFADYRVISGHYHARQDIKCGRPRKGAVGLFSYVGNPYTLNFGEANDPEKGFQILYDNGLLEFVPTGLRKHMIWDMQYSGGAFRFKISIDTPSRKKGDIMWIKIRGVRSELTKLTRPYLIKVMGFDGFKLDLIPTDNDVSRLVSIESKTNMQLLDELIDGMGETDKQKKVLKDLYREILNENTKS